MLFSLKEYAERYGYAGELPVFLDVLQKNARLVGNGEGVVADAIEHRLPKYAVVKIALANRDNCFGPDVIGEDEDCHVTTLEEWEQQGEDEFKQHLDENGKFRFSDFKIEPPPPMPDGPWFEELRRLVQAAEPVKEE